MQKITLIFSAKFKLEVTLWSLLSLFTTLRFCVISNLKFLEVIKMGCKVFITGATGFVGRALVSKLVGSSYLVTALVRRKNDSLSHVVEQVVGDLSLLGDASLTLNSTLFQGVDAVVHMAARVHMMNDDAFDPLVEFRKVNSDATLVLARMAAEAGVKRFVFLSSIKVNGEMTRPDYPFLPDDVFIPSDPYGLSKYEAEQGLLALAKETGMEVVIIRLPLVYGPGVKANFASMIQWVKKGIPLPFGAIYNKRSLVALDNLVDFLALCADREKSPKASNQLFLISDNEDVSTTELVQKVAKAFGKKALLLPVPVSLMTFVAKLLGRESVTDRLFSSLQVDSSKARELLGWNPVITMDEQLKKTADFDKHSI